MADARTGQAVQVQRSPSGDSAPRLIGALLAEQNEARLGRKYLDMDPFNEWAETRNATTKSDSVVAMHH